ncbi:MAG: type II toxin-antitoxin system RelE family toxin [Vagococcus fluvialis]
MNPFYLKTTSRFNKQFKKLDRFTQKQIKEWLMNNVEGSLNPREKGKGLTSNRVGQWRYRIGNYRVLVNIQDNECVVLALEVGHRREVY